MEAKVENDVVAEEQHGTSEGKRGDLVLEFEEIGVEHPHTEGKT